MIKDSSIYNFPDEKVKSNQGQLTAEFSNIMHLIFQRILNYCYKGQDINLLRPSDLETTKPVRKLTLDDVTRLFSYNTLVDKLFPNRMLFNKYMGYKTVRGNIKYLINTNASMYISTQSRNLTTLDVCEVNEASSHGAEQGMISSEEILSDIDMLSCGHLHMAEGGAVYEIDIYTTSSDISALNSHLFHHISLLPKVTPADGFLMVTFHDVISDKHVIDVLNKFGIYEKMPNSELEKVWFEKELHP